MKEIHVKIAEVHTGEAGEVLKATLGSCIGIAFIWKEKKLCGLAHCLLPENQEVQSIEGAKYVNQAIDNLMKMMKIKKENIGDIEVYLAGAGNMMKKFMKNHTSEIGKNNESSARKILSDFGFKITEARLGGNTGSKIRVDCTEMSVRFELLEELNLIAWKN